MAGQPLRKARLFADWEDRLWGLLAELSHLMPTPRPTKQKPEGKPDKPDFWIETFLLLERAWICAGELRFQLEEKAGMDAEALQREREEARGLWADETADANAT